MNEGWLQRGFGPVGVAVALATALLAGAWIWRTQAAWPEVRAEAARPAPVAWAPAPEPGTGWAALRRTAAPAPEAAPAGALAGRFRLAGTFFLSSTNNLGDRRAILDDLAKREQVVVGQGASYDGIEVVRVTPNAVMLKRGAEMIELRLSFAGGRAGAPAAAATNAAADFALETNRFGRRVGEARWVFNREELMKYYGELLEDPERIAALYTSMKPDYDAQRQIKGYRLQVDGEAEFFRAVGLRPGDVVRKVNSMEMTSQRRAEMFIGQFVKNQLNAFVLDIERDGRGEKLVYLLR